MSMENLEREAALARAAGKSYGKWKAMQTPVVIERKEDPNAKRCLNCGAVIVKATRSRFYCDAICGNQYRERMAKENPNLDNSTRSCEMCGKEFAPKTPSNKYCSNECASLGIKVTRKERRAKKKEQTNG